VPEKWLNATQHVKIIGHINWSIERMLSHHFPKFVIFKAFTFWSLILLAWLSYPADHAYSIMSHTFSFLGSWSEEHNPRYWWIFTCAMVFWGVAMVPITLRIYLRFREISPWAAVVGAFFMLVGSVGVVVVGLVPDAREILYGDTRWTEVHEIAAVMVGVGFALGILWHAGMILRDRFGERKLNDGHSLGLRSFAWPFAMWVGVLAVAVHNQVTWAQTYEARKAAAEAASTHIGSSWGESLNTVYAFPLWENIVIYALYAFLIWFALLVHRTEEA